MTFLERKFPGLPAQPTACAAEAYLRDAFVEESFARRRRRPRRPLTATDAERKRGMGWLMGLEPTTTGITRRLIFLLPQALGKIERNTDLDRLHGENPCRQT
jgi:hypothetical protein